MQSYFVDAWFFIAFVNRFDAHHGVARRVSQSLRPSSLVTHDGVFMEVLAYFSGYGRGPRAAAAESVRRALHSFDEVVVSDRALFAAGVSLYERRPDKKYSLVDCMSMELMWRRGITHVLTNDHHFVQEGFVVVNE